MNKEAAEIVACALEKDAADHVSGKYGNIGMCFDEVYGQILPIEEDVGNPIYQIAFRFLDDWRDASGHEWKYHDPIRKEQWPVFAGEIAESLRTGKMITNQLIIESFLPRPKESILARLKRMLKPSQF